MGVFAQPILREKAQVAEKFRVFNMPNGAPIATLRES
jgi:hypothetical protein